MPFSTGQWSDRSSHLQSYNRWYVRCAQRSTRGEAGSVMKQDRLAVGILLVGFEFPTALTRVIQCLADSVGQLRQEAIPNDCLTGFFQHLQTLLGLLLARSTRGIVVTTETKVGTIEGKVHVFGETPNGIEDLGQRRAALEDHAGRSVGQREQATQDPAHPEVLFHNLGVHVAALLATTVNKSARSAAGQRATSSMNGCLLDAIPRAILRTMSAIQPVV